MSQVRTFAERMAEVTAPVRVPPEPTPLDRERKTLNTLRCLAGQVEGYLEAASDPTCPASLVAQRRRVLRATLHAAQHVARAAERALSVTPEAIDREMARARRPDQPLPSHAATMNRAGEGVTLQPGAEPQ